MADLMYFTKVALPYRPLPEQKSRSGSHLARFQAELIADALPSPVIVLYCYPLSTNSLYLSSQIPGALFKGIRNSASSCAHQRSAVRRKLKKTETYLHKCKLSDDLRTTVRRHRIALGNKQQ